MMGIGATPVLADDTVEEGQKVVSYLPCWESRPWDVEDIDGDNLTHVYLSFARINNDFEISNEEMRISTVGGQYEMPDIVSADMIIDETWDKVDALKEKYPHLKVIVAVGGWEADGFSDMAANAANREIFVDSVVKYINEHNLDGIDIDWEYQVNGAWGVIDARPEDKENFTALIALLREKLGPDKEISFCANVSGWFFDAVELEKLVPLVDTVNLMTYDMHGNWDDKAYHHAALYPNPNDPVVHWGLTVSETVDRFLQYVPAEKLLVGVPTYGKEFRNILPGENGDGLFQPFATDAEGNKVADTGTWRSSIPYAKLRDYFVDNNGFTRYWDDAAKAPYLYDGQTFISYEDAESIRAKSEYIKEKDLAGIMYWEYVNDIDGDLLSVMAEVLR